MPVDTQPPSATEANNHIFRTPSKMQQKQQAQKWQTKEESKTVRNRTHNKRTCLFALTQDKKAEAKEGGYRRQTNDTENKEITPSHRHILRRPHNSLHSPSPIFPHLLRSSSFFLACLSLTQLLHMMSSRARARPGLLLLTHRTILLSGCGN